MFDWDDLKIFMAVAHKGSTISAAKSLGVNQSTVQRRLAQLESQLGQKLVERHASGYKLTDLGIELLPFAERVANSAQEFGQRLTELARRQAGIVRLTCPEPIAFRLKESGFLDRFHAANPDIIVEFVLSDKYVDLVKGDADVALRSGDTQDDILVGRKIADSLWALYASRQYVEHHGTISSLAELKLHPLIAFEETMGNHRIMTWLKEVAPEACYAARNTSVLGLIYASKASVGIAPLPMPLGDAEPDLVRVFGPVPELTRAWRILVHPDQRNSPRISAFFDFIIKEIENLRPILTG